MTPLAFVDCETTSLHRPCSPTPGEIWEVGLILRDQDGEQSFRWLLPVSLWHADPESLDIGGFHDRHPQGDRWAGRPDPDDLVVDIARWCSDFAALTAGAHLVGNVVSFDEERLAALLTGHGVEPAWDYHLVDVENLAVGWLAAGHDWEQGPPVADNKCTPPWDSEELSAALGVTPPGPEERHTAIGDALWARDLFDAVIGKTP